MVYLALNLVQKKRHNWKREKQATDAFQYCFVEDMSCGIRQLFYGITNLVHNDSSSHDVLIQGAGLSAVEASN